MTTNAKRIGNRIVTLVVRMWHEGSRDGASNGFRCEATHVQTGEVVYFRDVQELARYVAHLGKDAGYVVRDEPPSLG
ncbi:MAG: hypothetical protein HYX94_14085 [Chloroflexi bacterium]|nr:hypothetical protein [Chloroflexota bacterium]